MDKHPVRVSLRIILRVDLLNVYKFLNGTRTECLSMFWRYEVNQCFHCISSLCIMSTASKGGMTKYPLHKRSILHDDSPSISSGFFYGAPSISDYRKYSTVFAVFRIESKF